jgi:hypothetical protein
MTECYTCYDDGTVWSFPDATTNQPGHEIQSPYNNELHSTSECFPAGFKAERTQYFAKDGGSKPIACAERFKVESKQNQTLQWVNFAVTVLFAAVVTWFLFRTNR